MTFRGGVAELMRQAHRMQRRIERRKEELKAQTVEASSGNDRITVCVNGGQELVRVRIEPALLEQEELSMIEDLLVAAANAALKKSQEMVDAEIETVTGGLKIPGLF
ncbi:MAG: YbaB/EbfC family nucleoid-associated protein [Proteobacteria bacterium]|nr:YbaB/EbfC family nucleoid-associated protein [Pseudomonadota bacterium]